MDTNRKDIIDIVEIAALALDSQDAAKLSAKGPKVYANYDAARWLSGWRSNCQRSPLPALLKRAMPKGQAVEQGYKPTRRVGLKEYVLVATSFDPGYLHRASKIYYSVWGR